MAPNTTKESQYQIEEINSYPHKPQISEKKRYQWDIVWRNVFLLTVFHILGLYGMWLTFTKGMWKTILFASIYTEIAGLGMSAGAHRLWSHRTYKAKSPLKVFLVLCQTIMFHNSIYDWVRDHRVHHKFSDTDADPHNPTRGLFFAHIGWLLIRKHNDVAEKGKTVYMSDIETDPFVVFQKKYFLPLGILMGMLIPIHIPWYFWGEEYYIACFSSFYRYIVGLHRTALINSLAHAWGNKPYDKNIRPTESKFVSSITFGEGFHNYHHVFPWDYKSAELGNYSLNFTTAFLDLMSWIGQAYDLKTPSKELIQKRIKRTGDGSWKGLQDNQSIGKDNHHHHDDMIWGWGDIDMKEEDIQNVKKFSYLKDE